MQQLISRGSSVLFVLSAFLGCGVALAFTVTRTIGLPGATGDLGNWTEPLGLASLVVDVMLIGESGLAFFLSTQSREAVSTQYPRSAQESLR
jgi:hypothetical protein